MLDLEGRFHFTRIIAKGTVFYCFMSNRARLMTVTQKNLLAYGMVRYVEVDNGHKPLNKSRIVLFHFWTIDALLIHMVKITCVKNETCWCPAREIPIPY